jgi:MYXO-CTERM domain-containing protein
VRLEAVDPTNPDRIVAVVDHQGASPGATGMPDELLVSDDQGATFAKWATVTEFGGIAVAPDGRTWYGDNGDPASTDGPRGIYGAASLGAEAKQINGEMRVACLGYRPASGDLFACDRFEAGFVDATSGAYTKSFGFRDVASFIECPERDLCAESERQMLGAWCGITHFPESDVCCCYPPEAKGVDPKSLRGAEAEAILCPGDLDAGMLALPDAGPPGSGGTGGASGTGGAGGTLPTAGTAANDDGGCSCRTPGGEARTAPVGLVALAVACFAWRRRRARRHR